MCVVDPSSGQGEYNSSAHRYLQGFRQSTSRHGDPQDRLLLNLHRQHQPSSACPAPDYVSPEEFILGGQPLLPDGGTGGLPGLGGVARLEDMLVNNGLSTEQLLQSDFEDDDLLLHVDDPTNAANSNPDGVTTDKTQQPQNSAMLSVTANPIPEVCTTAKSKYLDRTMHIYGGMVSCLWMYPRCLIGHVWSADG